MKRELFLVVPLCLVVGGCASKPAPVSAPPVATPTSTAQPPNTVAPSAPSQSSSGLEKPAPKPPDPQPAPADASTDPIPAGLKTAAYKYYGLANTKPIDYELTGDGLVGVQTGSQKTSFKSISNGSPLFSQTRTGGLSILGDDEVSIDKVGVHVISSTIETVEPNNIEFPADVTPGKSWTSHDKISKDGIDSDIISRYTIKGVEPVKTKRGVLQALKITSVGIGTQNGQKLRMETESYYVKGIGLAKAVSTISRNSEKPSSVTQQLAH